jgi:hypothetical protein
MVRLAILDHAAHTLFIEDVADADLERYNGSEQDYIEDNYTFEGDYSWEYITDAEYIGEEDPDPTEIDFENWFN